MAQVFVRMPVTFDAAENDPIFSGAIGVGDQFGLEPGEVDVAVGVLGDGDDVGDRFSPRDLVRVVLERADEHHRPVRERDVVGEVVPVVEVGGQPEVQDADRACRSLPWRPTRRR